MHYVHQIPGRTVIIDGEEWRYFSGTGYLGMAHDPEWLHHLHEGLELYGAHFGGSRLSNLRLAVFDTAEAALAELTGAEAALTLSSGSLAAQLLVKYLAAQSTVCCAPGVHPALAMGWEVPRQSFEDWTRKFLSEITLLKPPVTILANSLDPLHARLYDFGWVAKIPGDVPVNLIVDDSHGLGITGREGGGIHTLLNLPDHVECIVLSSLGKALGIPGGVILGKSNFIQRLWQSPLFGGASPISPAYLHAFLQCRDRYTDNRKVLMNNIASFCRRVESLDVFEYIPHYPVFYTHQNELAPFLATHRIMISSFAYPTPADELITRVVINSLHTREDLETLATLVRQFTNRT